MVKESLISFILHTASCLLLPYGRNALQSWIFLLACRRNTVNPFFPHKNTHIVAMQCEKENLCN